MRIKHIKLANCKNFDIKADGTIFACTIDSVYKFDKNDDVADLVCKLVDFVQHESQESKDLKAEKDAKSNEEKEKQKAL